MSAARPCCRTRSSLIWASFSLSFFSQCAARLWHWPISGRSCSKLEVSTKCWEVAFSDSTSAFFLASSASSASLRRSRSWPSAACSSPCSPAAASRPRSASRSTQKSLKSATSRIRPSRLERSSWYLCTSARWRSSRVTALSISRRCWKCIRAFSWQSSSSRESLAYSSFSDSEPLMASSTPVRSVPCRLASSMTSPWKTRKLRAFTLMC